MAVLVRITAPGIDAGMYDQMSPALHELMRKQPGFIMHVAYATPGGFTVGEVWENQAQQEKWFNENVKPNLPDPASMSTEYIQVHKVVQP